MLVSTLSKNVAVEQSYCFILRFAIWCFCCSEYTFSCQPNQEKVTPILGHSVHFCQDNESISSYGAKLSRIEQLIEKLEGLC